MILSLQVFDLLYLLTGGGPGRETTVMNYYIYERTVQNLSFGYSSALAVVLFLVILALLVASCSGCGFGAVRGNRSRTMASARLRRPTPT